MVHLQHFMVHGIETMELVIRFTNRPMGYYEDFVVGFLTNPSGPDTFGRPVGLLVLKDGSLLWVLFK
jgi:glucose/arabinose dehydrogenase